MQMLEKRHLKIRKIIFCHEKMSKFESEFVTLNNTWTHISQTLFHHAWVESRTIVGMSDGDMKNKLTDDYLSKYETSAMIQKYLKDDSPTFTPINPDDTFDNLIKI